MTPVHVPSVLQAFLGAATRQSLRPLELDTNDAALAKPHQEANYSDRARKLLEYIGMACSRPGKRTKIVRELDYTLVDAASGDELQHYIDALTEQDLITASWDAHSAWTCAPSSKGWVAIQPTVSGGIVEGRCFVALAFREDVVVAYEEAIKPAIRNCGYEPRCMLEMKTIDGITDRILAEIRSAEFIVADFTHHRPGVYFEAGFAKGLGRPVVWSVREDQKDHVHFDVKHLGHIFWKDTAHLYDELVVTIQANIIRTDSDHN